MNKENKKLGMGLGALLNTKNQNNNNVNKIDITNIYPNKKQPRKNFEEKENHYYDLDDKEDSLYGLIQGKIATFMSYWYFASAVSKGDFDKLNEDIESGNA